MILGRAEDNVDFVGPWSGAGLGIVVLEEVLEGNLAGELLANVNLTDFDF